MKINYDSKHGVGVIVGNNKFAVLIKGNLYAFKNTNKNWERVISLLKGE